MKKETIVKKQYYTVEVEALVPTIIKYRVLAETAEDAVNFIDKSVILERPLQKITLAKKIKAKVYDFGTLVLRFSKNF